jgi:beta-glucosidase
MIPRLKHKLAALSLLVVLIATPNIARAYDPVLSSDAVLEQKIDGIIQQMTLEEKVSLCSGDFTGGFRGIPRLNIAGIKLTDGPRGPNGGGPSTAFPAGVLLGATWNPDLIQKAGQVMGNETRARPQYASRPRP